MKFRDLQKIETLLDLLDKEQPDNPELLKAREAAREVVTQEKAMLSKRSEQQWTNLHKRFFDSP